ncbi:GNAT family N-acetyltransferase [Lapillicoccus jejuensis]|uniref:RimJ/RimL family protein N-acetyltransferase n=1 Tax=Lapillicoccus jejuensis TaxID=402171 RepID=A0A542E2J4_9MICO|nr:GNAT family N-acetyltransferase [Lapillicoccus jejuensis]TQJ09560.1 RimJ/RimL family protein N-acetyltransferase [Lapillicoccus jejuensis]
MSGASVELRPADDAPPGAPTRRYDVLDAAGRRVGGVVLADGPEPGGTVLRGGLDPAHRGAGLGRAALDAVLDLVLGDDPAGVLGDDAVGPTRGEAGRAARVEVRVDADDRAALRLLRRAGFRTVGTLRPGRPDPAEAFGAGTVLLERRAGDDVGVEPLVLPTLRTGHLVLRGFRDDDVPGPDEGPDEDSRLFLPAGAHPDAASYPAWLARVRRRQDAGEALTWAVTRAGEDHPLGYVVLFRLEATEPAEGAGGGQGELGYLLHPPARGRRVLPGAIAAVVAHAFAPVGDGGLGLRRLHAVTDRANLASQALLRGAGFRCWGTEHGAWRGADGEPRDGAAFELLAPDPWGGGPATTAPAARGLRLPRLEGLIVRLRPVTPDDLPRVVEGCRDVTTRHWLADLPHPYTLASAEQYLARTREHAADGSGLFLAVADVGDDRLLGAVGLMGLRTTPGQAEVGYWTHPAERDRGVMTEAVRLVVRHAFAPRDAGGLGLRRLTLRAADGNEPSQRVARSAGFTRTGRQRAAERLGDGRYVDLLDHDLLEQEWDARADGPT